MAAIEVYIESTKRKAFVCAVDWPGWCRSGKTEDEALETFVAYGTRYKKTIGAAAKALTPPKQASAVKIVEHVKGNATTEFGAPGVPAKLDAKDLSAADLKRQLAILRASWKRMDARAASAKGTKLTLGPRGGGRQAQKMLDHVIDADHAYLMASGGHSVKDAKDRAQRIRADIVDVLTVRAAGEPAPRMPRSGKVWPVRYAIRRSAWHALDHVWEIEDRS